MKILSIVVKCQYTIKRTFRKINTHWCHKNSFTVRKSVGVKWVIKEKPKSIEREKTSKRTNKCKLYSSLTVIGASFTTWIICVKNQLQIKFASDLFQVIDIYFECKVRIPFSFWILIEIIIDFSITLRKISNSRGISVGVFLDVRVVLCIEKKTNDEIFIRLGQCV